MTQHQKKKKRKADTELSADEIAALGNVTELPRSRKLGRGWRWLSLMQMIATPVVIVFTLGMFFNADTILEVMPKLRPGRYPITKIPDDEFANFATNVVNLIATYQPSTARYQFESAERFLWDTAAEKFTETAINEDLPQIESSYRTQAFYYENRNIIVERDQSPDKVRVFIPGTRQRLQGEQVVGLDNVVYYVVMTVVPRNVVDPYGIVATDLGVQVRDR